MRPCTQRNVIVLKKKYVARKIHSYNTFNGRKLHSLRMRKRIRVWSKLPYGISLRISLLMIGYVSLKNDTCKNGTLMKPINNFYIKVEY